MDGLVGGSGWPGRGSLAREEVFGVEYSGSVTPRG